jgi:hypothetical protein
MKERKNERKKEIKKWKTEIAKPTYQ